MHIARACSVSGSGVGLGVVTTGLIFLQATLMRLRRTRRLATEDFFVRFSACRNFLHFAGATTARADGSDSERASVVASADCP